MATIQKVSGIDFANISKFDGVDISAVGSINFIGKPATGNLLLDTSYGSGAEAAYSVRKLRTAYTGAAIQVQATTGGATAEIGFDVDNNLDTATLLAFAGTNEVGVSIWYDQSTNGNNATQISVAQRPIVVAAGGALVEDNGKMALDFDGSNDGFYSSGVSLTDSMDVFILSHKESTTRQAWFAFDAATNINYYRQEGGTVTPRIYASFNQGLFNFNFLSPNYQTQILNNLSGTNGAQEVFFDGVSVHTSNATFSNPGLSGLHLGIQSNGANEFNGKYQEFILYDTVKSSTNRTSIEENIGDYYTQNTPLLDTYSGAAAAYSLRKLRTDYTGFAIKVQDNVGGATQDIGFNVFGELDTVSLLQYAGSNDVFVVTWFDQSGGSLDMTPISSSNRGQIVVSGVVNTNSEGKVFIDMNPSQYPLGASIPQPYQIVTVWKANSDRRFLNGSGFDFNLQSDKLRFLIGSSIAGSTNINNAIINLATASVDSGAAIIRLNGNVEATGTISTSAIPSNSIVFSRLNNPSWGPEQSYEFIIFDSVQSDITGIESNINTFYDIYTPTPDPLLLNLYPGSAAAYSLRKLNANYTGSAILVQDTVGGATKAIGFDANGDLDTVELLAYAGSNDVLVATWFDQSGSGNDATQPSSALRPQIVSSGAVIVDANGKPEVQFSALFSLDMATRLTQVQSNFSVRENITTGASVDFLYGDISTYDYHAGGTNNYLDTLYSSTDVRNGSNFVNGQSQSFTTANTATTSSVLLSMIHLSNTARISQICQDRSRSNRSWNGNMQEIILYENDQSAKLTDIEENIGGYYDIPLAGLLDENPGAAAAYSLRRLSSTYTGSAVQIQRADNVGGTTDIGFDSYGDLDTTALTTAAAGNSMVVTTWFDQSGSGNDATQGTSANRPKIYDATTGVVLENGKPAVDFDTFGMRLVAPNAASLQIIGDLFASVVTAGVNEIGHGPLFIKRTSDSQREYELRFNSATQMKYLDSFNNKNYAISSSANQRLFVLRRVADTSAELFENGLSISSQSLSGTAFTTTAGLSIGGREAGDYNLDGVLQEVILWPSQQTANRPSIEENIGGYYDIPLAGLLDENPGAAAAYSLRRLSSTYTGSAIQVQRADNVGGTTDIGFDSYGDLDTTALTTAAQGNDMVVTTWFDQSGSGNNATQGTSANRPKIYDGTTGVIVENGKPAVDFDGGTDTLTHSSDIALAACSIFTTLTAVAAIRVWYGETDQNYLATFSGNVTCTASTSQRNAVHTPSGQTLYNYTRNGSVGGTV